MFDDIERVDDAGCQHGSECKILNVTLFKGLVRHWQCKKWVAVQDGRNGDNRDRKKEIGAEGFLKTKQIRNLSIKFDNKIKIRC